MSEDDPQFQRLSDRLEELGKSRAEFMSEMNITSRQVMQNWKRRGIPAKDLLAAADAAHCNVYWLRHGSPHPKVSQQTNLGTTNQTILEIANTLDHLPNHTQKSVLSPVQSCLRLTNEPSKSVN